MNLDGLVQGMLALSLAGCAASLSAAARLKSRPLTVPAVTFLNQHVFALAIITAVTLVARARPGSSEASDALATMVMTAATAFAFAQIAVRNFAVAMERPLHPSMMRRFLGLWRRVVDGRPLWPLCNYLVGLCLGVIVLCGNLALWHSEWLAVVGLLTLPVGAAWQLTVYARYEVQKAVFDSVTEQPRTIPVQEHEAPPASATVRP